MDDRELEAYCAPHLGDLAPKLNTGDLSMLRGLLASVRNKAEQRGRDYSGRHDGRFILRDELGTARFSSYASEVELRIGVSPEEAVAVLDMVCDLRGLPRNVGPALKVVGGKGGAR